VLPKDAERIRYLEGTIRRLESEISFQKLKFEETLATYRAGTHLRNGFLLTLQQLQATESRLDVVNAERGSLKTCLEETVATLQQINTELTCLQSMEESKPNADAKPGVKSWSDSDSTTDSESDCTLYF
jgi:hypothetical protein